MNYTPPNKILISSDENILQFIKTKKVLKGEEVYVYRFIVSKNKLGLEFEMTQSFIERQLNNYFKIIE